MCTRHLSATLLYFSMVHLASADLNQYLIRTTEWLVDHSSVVCVADFTDTEVGAPRILHVFKGDVNGVRWPLKEPKFNGRHYLEPPANGTVKLLFIGKRNELWQTVGLARQQPTYVRNIRDVFYGVDQYGNVHLTESSLFRGVRTQIAKQKSASVSRRRHCHAKVSGIEAPAYFPLEGSEETYVLVVDFNVERRDHFVARLKDGNVAERIHAIKELAGLDDPVAVSAIKTATHVSSVQPSFVYDWHDKIVREQSDETVRNSAKKALAGISEATDETAGGRKGNAAH